MDNVGGPEGSLRNIAAIDRYAFWLAVVSG